MGREFELKYQADGEKLAAIREKFGDFTPISMRTVYYDTPNGDLEKRRRMLRQRTENGKSVCTLKIPLPDGSRGEWETDEKSVAEAIPELCKLGAPNDLISLCGDGLVPTCAAEFTRLCTLVSLQNAAAELALDAGVFIGNGKKLPFAEVEVELKFGEEAAVTAFAQALAKEFSLTPEPKSKVQRALALAKNET